MQKSREDATANPREPEVEDGTSNSKSCLELIAPGRGMSTPELLKRFEEEPV